MSQDFGLKPSFTVKNDPTITSVLAPKGSLLLYQPAVGAPQVFQKQDDGDTTNWTDVSGGGGSVSSVALTVPSFLSVAGSPITTSGTLAVTLSGTALPILNGGTGATTAATALTNLGGATRALDNLLAVAINTSLLPATNNSIDLGSGPKYWANLHLQGSILGNNGDGRSISMAGMSFQTGTGSTSLGWNTRTLIDSNGINTVSWQTKILRGDGNAQALDWADGFLNATNGLRLRGSISGAITHQAAATTTSYTVNWPAAQGAVSTVLQNNGSGVLSWATSTSGTVTSVAATVPAYMSVTGSPITTSGTLAFDFNSEAANLFFASPNGSAGVPSFRSIAAADIPTLNQNTTGTASNITATSNSTLTTLNSLILSGAQVSGDISGNAVNVTGIVAVANGGTSLSTLTANNVILGNGTSAPTFVAPGTSGNVLTSNGTTWTSATPVAAAGTAPTVQRFLSGSGTYTRPTSPTPLYIRVRLAGGGGGGAGGGLASNGAGQGGTGVTTTFGTSLLTAVGGVGGVTGDSSLVGILGSVTVNSPAIDMGSYRGGVGGHGGNNSSALTSLAGGNGGTNAFGGSGGGGHYGNGSTGTANTGAGGGGSAGQGSAAATGDGGQSGGYIDAIISSPSATYAYAVGAGGTGGVFGTPDLGTGGVGGTGVIIVTEYYQ